MLLLGILAVLGSAIGNGSYYVPVKRHEVHDGLVYQWYQCSGILLGGIAFTMQRNVWADPAGNFYFSWEGLLAGFIWTLANVFATMAVKLCGLGTYFILHEMTNIGGAFLVGVFGNYVGLDVAPPNNISIAALGVALVFAGAIPVVFIKPTVSIEGDKDPKCKHEPLIPSPRERKISNTTDSPPLSDQLFEPLLPLPYLERNAFTWDGASPLTLKHSWRFTGDISTMPMVLELESPGATETGADSVQIDEVQRKGGVSLRGVLCCLLCGVLWCTMYLPMPFWVKRMARSGRSVSASDFLFSVCLGIYSSSTIWLLGVGAIKKLQGQRVEKSVLRPALVAGMVWTVGCVCTLHAVQLLPYAVAYCSSAGGALLVSLLWGMFVFNEAEGSHNKRCIFISFIIVFSGMVLLGLSAR